MRLAPVQSRGVCAVSGSFIDLALPARVERVTVESDDGTPVSSWLLLPPGVSAPAPLATFIDGGPVNSWSGWHWRWNPHVFVDDGWAVLLPDPALSTGYGLGYIRRGWGRWGDIVYGDLMSAVDGAATRERSTPRRPSRWAARSAATWRTGSPATPTGSGPRDPRGLWDLALPRHDRLRPVVGAEFGDPYAEPARYANTARTARRRLRDPDARRPRRARLPRARRPGARGSTDLQARRASPARLVYFPDENHWVLKPNNARLWYETVLGYLDHHARGRKWIQPDLLVGQIPV